jgi:hypothetical protein
VNDSEQSADNGRIGQPERFGLAGKLGKNGDPAGGVALGKLLQVVPGGNRVSLIAK